MDIRDIAPHAKILEKGLSPLRLQKMLAHKKEEDRLRSLGAGLFLGHFLKAPDSSFQYTPHGKPFLPNGPHFNLSHSGNLVFLAIDTAPIGVDVEMWRAVDFDEIAASWFHPEEKKWMNAAPHLEKAFFDLWALKESHVKMLGSGLSKKISDLCLCIRENHAYLENRAEMAPYFRLFSDIPGYSLALCSLHQDLPDTVIPVSSEEILHKLS